ncbi:MAG: glycosyltransferase [Phycisphaerales bacterium]|nr:glycosyltransferase [Phycisphaerales bacterium]
MNPAWLDVLMGAGFLMAFVPSALAMRNTKLLHRAGSASPSQPQGESELVSCCIPARNEADNLEACIQSILQGGHDAIEVLVYDDESTDDTPRILQRLAEEDPRIRAVETQPLPDGFNGKQHACQRMGEAARGDWLFFTDADVRFEPNWLKRTMASASPRERLGLLSAFPREIAATIGEMLLVPMIHVLLLGYLPIKRMRNTLDPPSSAGCGQFLLARRQAWEEAGGHAAFANSMHDGIKLPRAVRKAGWQSDLVDGTDLCHCRMYRGLGESFRGFAKNAYEGLGSIWILLLLTVIHLLGHLLPWGILLYNAITATWMPLASGLAVAAIAMTLVMRVRLALRFRQPLLAVALHPAAVILTSIVQWWSLFMQLRGRRSWRGRSSTA